MTVEIAGDPNLAAILKRVASILSDIHLDGLSIQREFGNIFNNLSDVPTNISELQRLDHLSQMHGDLAAYLAVLAKDVGHGTVDNTRLGEALRLGAMRKRLINEDDASMHPDSSEGDVSLF